jgi:polysaccharide biosynthesis/export protein
MLRKYNPKTFLVFFRVKLVLLIFFSSCISKKQVLYLQNLKNIDVSKTNIIHHTFQENDILKIDVTSLETKASVPYNKVPTSMGIGNSINLLQLSGYLVSNKKTIKFPVLGLISVAGKTTEALESYITDRLKSEGHLINPNVSVRLLNAKVTILGEVKAPGTYTFTENNMSFLQALGLAGDLTIDGDRKNITLIRESDGQRTTSNLDLTSAIFLSSLYQNIQPNDVIIVNPNSKKVTSAGLIGNISTILSIASVLLSTIILIR